MGGRRRDRERRPARRAPTRAPRRRLLVVCEGLRTEPDYIRGFVQKERNSAVQVEIADERGEPRRVVEIAKERATSANREAKRQGDAWLRFDEVWCVFDRDEHPRFDAACDMARGNGFELAVSNPCFELWLLLHFRESPGARHRHEVHGLLREHLPGYDKRLDFASVEHGIDHATRRARRLDEEASEMRELGRNPTTGCHRLIASIAGKGGVTT